MLFGKLVRERRVENGVGGLLVVRNRVELVAPELFFSKQVAGEFGIKWVCLRIVTARDIASGEAVRGKNNEEKGSRKEEKKTYIQSRDLRLAFLFCIISHCGVLN